MYRSKAVPQQHVSLVGTETEESGGGLTAAAAASAIVTALFLPPSSSDFDGPVLALAIVILLLILHHVAFAEHVAVGDDRDVAEDVLAAAVQGLDEPEATRVPPCGLPLQTLTAPATATTAAAIAVVAAARGAAGARTPATFDPQL